MIIEGNLLSTLIGSLITLVGVSLTLRYTNRNQAAMREHDRAMRQEERRHAQVVAARDRKRQVYEQFLASVDATQHAVSVLYSARQSGRDPEIVPGVSGVVMESSARLYAARSLLDLYGSPEASAAGLTLSAQVLDVQGAYARYADWQRDLLRFRERFAVEVRLDLEPPLSPTKPEGARFPVREV